MRAALIVVAALGCCAATSASSPVAALAGRYGSHFQNGLVDGTSYASDDVLEIVPVGADAAYFRANLQFYNGHSCDIFGIAHAEGGRLVYRPKNALNKGCTFGIRRNGAYLATDDEDGICRQYYCGARGGLDDDKAFLMKSRRAISYLPRLKASTEYRAALAEDGR